MGPLWFTMQWSGKSALVQELFGVSSEVCRTVRLHSSSGGWPFDRACPKLVEESGRTSEVNVLMLLEDVSTEKSPAQPLVRRLRAAVALVMIAGVLLALNLRSVAAATGPCLPDFNIGAGHSEPMLRAFTNQPGVWRH